MRATRDRSEPLCDVVVCPPPQRERVEAAARAGFAREALPAPGESRAIALACIPPLVIALGLLEPAARLEVLRGVFRRFCGACGSDKGHACPCATEGT